MCRTHRNTQLCLHHPLINGPGKVLWFLFNVYQTKTKANKQNHQQYVLKEHPQQKSLVKINERQAVSCMQCWKAADEMQKVRMCSFLIQKFKHLQFPHKSKFVIKQHLKCYVAKTSAKASRQLLIIFLTITQEIFPGPGAGGLVQVPPPLGFWTLMASRQGNRSGSTSAGGQRQKDSEGDGVWELLG